MKQSVLFGLNEFCIRNVLFLLIFERNTCWQTTFNAVHSSYTFVPPLSLRLMVDPEPSTLPKNWQTRSDCEHPRTWISPFAHLSSIPSHTKRAACKCCWLLCIFHCISPFLFLCQSIKLHVKWQLITTQITYRVQQTFSCHAAFPLHPVR